ncbi:MAG: MFS transporter [Promethearchaeota archaeon]
MTKKLEYRLFPLFTLAFLRVASTFSITLALPLFYHGKLNDGLIGFLTGATALSYLLSPYLFRNAYKKIGIKNSLLIATGGMLCVQIGLQFSLEYWIPTYLLLFYDGISLGLFWPIITSAYTMVLSHDGIRDNEKEKDKLSRNLGLSWNIGGIFGYSISAIALFVITDIILVFRISLIYMIIAVISAFLFEEPKSFDVNGELLMEKEVKLNSKENYVFPYIVPLLIASIFSFVSGCFGILFPIKFDILGYDDFLAYLLSFIRMISQTIVITAGMTFKISTLKRLVPMSIVLMVINIFIFGLLDNFIIYGIVFGLLGALFGIFYCFPFKMSILKNMEKNNMRGTTYFETAIGLNFWLGPVIGGFMLVISPLFGFMILTLIILIIGIVYLIFQNRIKPI